MKILNLYDVCILPATMNFLFCITFLPYIYPYKVFQGLSYIYPYKVFCHIFTLLRSFRDALFEIVTRLNIYAPQLSNWLCIVLMIWCRIVNCEETRYIVIGKNADELFECVWPFCGVGSQRINTRLVSIVWTDRFELFPSTL